MVNAAVAARDAAQGYAAQLVNPIVCFTFDDGYSEDALTYSILKEFGFVGNFGLISESIYGATSNSPNLYYQYQAEGFEVLSHSASHPNVDAELSADQKFREFAQSAEKLRQLGFSANGLIAPFSTINAANVAYALNVYDYILIGGTGLNGPDDFRDKKLTRISQASGVAASKALIDQAISENKLLIFYDHRIGVEGSLTEADFREILTYLKTKTDAGLAEVHNIKNAVSKYYGISLPDRAYQYHPTNYVNPFTEPSWAFGVNTATATKTSGTPALAKIINITFPPTATVGQVTEYVSTVTMPSVFWELGERLNFSSDIALSNSQFARVKIEQEIVLLDSSDTVLLTKTQIVYPAINRSGRFDMDVLCEYPVVTDNVAKVKLIVRATLLEGLTVDQFIYLRSPMLRFAMPAYNYVAPDDYTTITANSATPDLSGMTYALIDNTEATTITGITYTSTKAVIELTLYFCNGNTTIDGSVGGNIRTFDGNDIVATAGSVVTLIKCVPQSSAWYEKSRAIRTV